MKTFIAITIFLSVILIASFILKIFPWSHHANLDDIKIQIRQEFPKVNHIATDDFNQMMQKEKPEVVLLDVRDIKEYKISHIQNAELSTDIQDALEILKNRPKDTKIIAYCSVGYRSSALAKQLASYGYSNVYNMEGSIFEWANKGYPVYRQGEKVHQVHPYSSQWGKLLDKSYHPEISKP